MIKHTYGERIQELKDEIRTKLERFGIINVNFYYPDSQHPKGEPYIEYEIRTPRIRDCGSFIENITRIITVNHPGVVTVHLPPDYQKPRQLHKIELETNPEAQPRYSQSKEHGLLSLFNQQLVNLRQRR